MSDRSMRPLSHLFELVSERSFGGKDLSLPYIGLEHIPSSGSLIRETGRAADSISTNGVFRGGDVLFGKLRPRLRKCVRVLIPGYCSTDVLVLRPSGQVDAVFSAFVAQSDAVFGAAIRTEEGTKMPRCSWKELKDVQVYCPSSKFEQQRIAAVLACIDTAIEKTEALIEKYQQIKAGLMHDLFTRGVLPDGQLRPCREQAPELYAQTEIGWIPSEWEVRTVEELCSAIVDCPHSTPEYGAAGIPCIRTADMAPGKLLLDQAYRVSEWDYRRRIERLEPAAGDIIYSREGERLGIASPVGTEKVCLGQRVMLLRPADGVSPEFLMWAMNMPSFYRQVVKGLGATTSPHVNVGDIRRIYVPQPSAEEGDRIGRSIACAHLKIEGEFGAQAGLQRQKLGLMQDLLTGKVPVKVDEPAPESVDA